MVAREVSINYNEALNNKSEPNFAVSEAEEGFIGEIMLKDEPDEKKQQQPVYISKMLRRLSLGKNKSMINNNNKATKSDSVDGSAGEGTVHPDDYDDDSDNDYISIISAGTISSKQPSRGLTRHQMREAIETPSVLRRLRRRDSEDSSSTLISACMGVGKQQELQDDDDEDHESINTLNDAQAHQIVLTNTALVSDNMGNDQSDGEETCYSQLQPSLNHSLRAERSMFMNSGGDNVGVIAVESSLDQSLRMDRLEDNTNCGNPMIIMLHSQSKRFHTISCNGEDESWLDASICSEVANSEPVVYSHADSTPSDDNIGSKSEKAEKPHRFLKREKTSSVVSKRHKFTGKKRHYVSPKRNHHSTSSTGIVPQRNSSIPKRGDEKRTFKFTGKKRHSVIPKRNHHSTSSAGIVPQQNSRIPKRGDEKRTLTSKREKKSPKRCKCPKRERATSTASKREKALLLRTQHQPNPYLEFP